MKKFPIQCSLTFENLPENTNVYKPDKYLDYLSTFSQNYAVLTVMGKAECQVLSGFESEALGQSLICPKLTEPTV